MRTRRIVGLSILTATGVLAAHGAVVTARPAGPLVPISRHEPIVVNRSFVNPLMQRFGDVRIGRGVFVAGNSTLQADPGRRLCLGNAVNVQDNVLVGALRGEPSPPGGCRVRGTTVAPRTSIAHQAEVVNSHVGRFTFIGFRARISNAKIENGAFVLHAATIRDVTIGEDRLVPVGAVITRQPQADALPLKQEAHAEFQREVLEVNHEFAEQYPKLYRAGGFEAVTGVSPSPHTSFNPGLSPTLGSGVRLERFVRIVGDVRLGDDGRVGRRTSIRADEGSPIIVGDRADIGDRVTFHALTGTGVEIGDDLHCADNVVFHGPLVAGDRLTVARDAILFRAVVGDDVTIGDSAVVIGPADDPIDIPNGKVVPAGAIVTTQAELDALP